MKIKHFEIQNYRKLKLCRLDVSEKETLLVGANNSGKTAAMQALIFFLGKKVFNTSDLTLSNWDIINEIGVKWINSSDEDPVSVDIEEWIGLLPTLDIWFAVEQNELYQVINLIPTLDWDNGNIGVRIIYFPADIKKLYKDFRQAVNSKSELNKNWKDSKDEKEFLWPLNLEKFLERNINNYFSLKYFNLDSSKLTTPTDSCPNPQTLLDYDENLGANPLVELIRVDIIDAQREFSDSNSEGNKSPTKLSNELKGYYIDHLDPELIPTINDLEALEAIFDAQTSFDDRINVSFKSAIEELETLGYPGFTDPKITLSSKVNPIDSFQHSASVRYEVGSNIADKYKHTLPENYNGLGYQNLVSMVFRLIRFRANLLNVNKKRQVEGKEKKSIEPIHLVLIEEPEAHLHIQVQQVFINKAYDVLRRDVLLGENSTYSTQMIISTHSSNIAHEVDFKDLRYFRRNKADNINKIPLASVVNLSEVFGLKDQTTKFVSRYLKTTHCDLFFADGIIIIEGAAERMLIPQFIKKGFVKLTSRYISILEIIGSHAHTLKPLIEALDIPTLIITDIDTGEADGNHSAVLPEIGKNYITNNSTIKTWMKNIKDYDTLVSFKQDEKISENGKVCIAYQTPIKIEQEGEEGDLYPYTFEDSILYMNISYFKELPTKNVGGGLLKRFIEIANTPDVLKIINQKAYDALKNKSNSKAKFALELLFLEDSIDLKPPTYIKEGLQWLEKQLTNQSLV